MNKQYLESLIHRTMENGRIERFNLVQQNTSFKQSVFITHKNFNATFYLLMNNKESLDDATFDLIHTFYNYIERIPGEKYQFYIDCISLLTDYINLCIPYQN